MEPAAVGRRGDHWTPISPDVADAEGGQWTNTSAHLPKKWVSRVIASAHQPGTVYATLTGYRQDDFRPYVYVSDDSGATWRSIAGNLPLSSVNVIREDPVRPDVLYAGTEQGVYVTFDRGIRWQSLSANLPTVAVHDLVLQAQVGDLLIATYGLGAWKLELTPVRALTDSIRSQALHLFAPRAVTLDDDPWETVPGDRRGRAEATLHYWSAAAAPVTLVVRDSAERTMRTLTGRAGAGAHTVTWDLLDDHAREVRAGRYRVEVRSASGRDSGELLLRPRRR